MAQNDYYSAPTPKLPTSTIRSGVRNDDAAAVEAGFDKLPSELNVKRSQYGTDNSTTAALYEITVPNLDVDYYTGLEVTFQAMFTNTGIANIRVNGRQIVQIVDTNGNNIIAGSIRENQAVTVVYVPQPNPNFQLISTAVTAQDVADARTAAATATTAATEAQEAANNVRAESAVVRKFLRGV